MEERWKQLLVVLVIALGVAGLWVVNSRESARRELIERKEIGVELVKTLYDYNDLKELGENQEKLKEMTTKEVFETVGVDYQDRGLSVYLKFKGGPVRVVIEEVGRDFVTYSVENEHISANRTFIVMFDLDRNGKISWVREGEIYDY